MDKISRILPATNRVVIADSADAQPARPGAPAFGRPMGRNSLGDRITLSQKALEAKMTGEVPTDDGDMPVTYKNNSDSAKKQLIEKLSNQFFNPKAEVRGSEMAASEITLRSMQDNDEEFPSMRSKPEGKSAPPVAQLPPIESRALPES